MKNRVLIFFLTGFCALTNLISCTTGQIGEEKAVRAVVSVTVTSPRTGKIAEYSELIATSAFLDKVVVRSPVTGYVEKCSVSQGDKVTREQILYTLRTREAVALQHDSVGPINISGVVNIKASLAGVVASADHPPGDFVQEGDALATIVVPESLVFLLEVPYEMKSLIRIGQEFRLVLPYGATALVRARSVLPAMSGASQTQRIVLQPSTAMDVPENLMARVKVARTIKNNATILPKSCLLNDELMKNFWVMKMVNDSMAVKIPVAIGIQGADSIEVAMPLFGPSDRILSSGNYGLSDTSVVRVIK